MSSEVETRRSDLNVTDQHSGMVEGSETDPDLSIIATPEAVRSGTSVRRTRSQEAVRTLLSSFGKNADKSTDEFTKEDIKFKDLAALSDEDLTVLGVTDPETRSAMLETFQDLPNQDMNYDRLCSTAEAETFNENILSRAQNHLNSMNNSLSAAYLKMLVSPSNDVVLDGTVFASRFVVDALDELKRATEDMEDRLRALEQVAVRDAKVKLADRTGKHIYKTLIILGGICTGVSIAFWLWRRR